MPQFKWLTEYSRQFLSNGYLTDNETAEARLKGICDHAQHLLNIEGFSDKLYGYLGNGWISLSSPVWANFGKARGLPVSCFNSHLTDDVGGILYGQAEVGVMSKMGGGTSGYFGDIRPRGSRVSDSGITSGTVHFMELFQAMTDVVSQGGVRRGRFAAYLPIDHGDIEEFLNIGTEGHPIQSVTNAVSVSDEWMTSMIAGDRDKRRLWAKVLHARNDVGYPYVFNVDNANRNRPDVYKDKGLTIKSSNLCSEIMLPSTEDESFVCVLSSVNLLHYDEWKDTDLVETMVYFLDAVVTEFLTKLEECRDSPKRDEQLTFQFMERAYNFAKRHRALGLGTLGWHSLLQSKMIPFEDAAAFALNREVHKHLQDRSHKASQELAALFGEPEILKGYGRRNTTLNAIAPTTSSAFILGQVSQSIEPLMSNHYIKDLSKLKVEVKNPYLKTLLRDIGLDTPEVWEEIAQRDGSVSHIELLTHYERAVFKTFREIDQGAVIQQAADRQEFLDQSQSLNLMITSDTPVKQVNQYMIDAWKAGLPTLYYQHNVNAAQEFARSKLSMCTACEA